MNLVTSSSTGANLLGLIPLLAKCGGIWHGERMNSGDKHWWSLVAAGWLSAVAMAGAGTTNDTLFGFTGPETFPIDNFVTQLRSADLDGDGLEDLVVANNSRSKITILYNQTGKTNAPAPSVGRKEINELPPDARFRISSIASEKRIACLIVADFNNDRRPDLAYYGDPKELVVQFNQHTNGWSLPVRWPIEDGQLTPNSLNAGDLNGDGRTDLVLLGDSAIYYLEQTPERTLAEPIRIPYAGAVKSAQILDINGDRREDLLLVNWDHAYPFRFRLQNAAGQLGPELHFAMPPIRSYWADDLDADHKTEIITIAQNSGRSAIANFTRNAASTVSGTIQAGQFNILPLNKSTKARRGQAWGDVNGDGRPDLLVAEPDSGQLTIYLQQSDGSLGEARAFSTLTGVTELAVIKPSTNEPAQICLLSPDERQVGVTTFDAQGRVAFPTPVPLNGRPLAMTLGTMRPGEKPMLSVVVDQDGKRTLVTRTATGETKTQNLSEQFKSNPTRMAIHDADQDGLADLVVLIPYEKIKILRQVPGKPFEEVDVAPPGGTVEQPWLSVADVDADGQMELLLAQKNFLRAVVLVSDNKTPPAWSFKVEEQINGAGSNSRIVGAAALPRGTNQAPALFLLDAERKALTLCEPNTNGTWEVVRNVLLPFTEFNEIQAVALGAAQPNSIAFIGLNAAGWMALGGEAWTLTELDSYETPIKDAYLHDVISGDLNQNKRKDLVFLETGKNYLDIVLFDAKGKLTPANRWQVFEERSFRSRRGEQAEPREALIADLTGDGKNDLAVLVHDRILVYPQE